MTNEQLSVLLSGLHAELGAALEQSRGSFGRPMVMERTHVGAPGVLCLGFMCNDETHYRDMPRAADAPELAAIEAFWESLGERIERLTKKT